MGKKKEELNDENAVVTAAANPEESVSAENANATETTESAEGKGATDSNVNESEALEALESTESEAEAKDIEAQPESPVSEAEAEAETKAKDTETATATEAEADTEPEGADAEIVEDELPEGPGPNTASSDEVFVGVTEPGQVLTGNFKVYRGRNISTITAMCSIVVRDGDEIVENSVRWLPVVFNNKAGTLSRGFIIVK